MDRRSKEALKDNQYNYQAITAFAWRRRLIIFLKSLIFLPILAVIFYYTLNYLYHLPRERAQARLTYWDHILYGLNFSGKLIGLSLTTKEVDLAQTKLPVVEIYLRGERLDALNANLPESGKVFQSGYFRIRNLAGKDYLYKAKLRYRGDSIHHWGFPHKSWRVKLGKNKKYRSMRVFNLYTPRTASQVADFIGYELAKQFGGLLVPIADPVHFRLNRKFDGMRVLLEQVNESFPENHQLDPGKIYVGDISTEDIYSNKARKKLFETSEKWEVLSLNSEQLKDRSEIENLIKILKSNLPENTFIDQIEQVIDVPMTLRYMALLELVGSSHIDDTHNHKYYVNDKSKKLQPIVWDTVPYYWGNSRVIDFGSNQLFRSLLKIDRYRNLKNQYLMEALQNVFQVDKLEALINKSSKLIENEVRSTPFKARTFSNSVELFSNQDWVLANQRLPVLIRERNSLITNALQNVSGQYYTTLKPDHLCINLKVSGSAMLEINQIDFNLNQSKATSEINIFRPEADSKKIVSFSVSENESNHLKIKLSELFASQAVWDKRKNMLYHEKPSSLCFSNAKQIKSINKISAVNSVTKQPINLAETKVN